MAKCLHILVWLSTLGTCPVVFCQTTTTAGQTQTTQQPTNTDVSMEGVLTDAETGEPIPYATLVLYQHQEAVQGAITDETGKYRLVHIPQGQYELHLRYIGYKDKTMEVEILSRDANKQKYLDVSLEPDRPCICAPVVVEPELNDKTVQTYKGWLAEHILLQNGGF